MPVSEDAIGRLKQQGFKAKTVSVAHLPELQKDIDRLIRHGLIDEAFQKSYLHFYYDPSGVLPGAQTVFIVAMPQPITRATFIWKGKTYHGDLSPGYFAKTDEVRTEDTLAGALEPDGYKIAQARLPFKTLAVRSGLAQYGRNNITYVPGFGSFQRLVAFYSDCPCDTDSWRQLKVMKACENCNICQQSCPAGSIGSDRFLIRAENCRTWSSEHEDVVLEWVRSHWHNTILGCMLWQMTCPANKAQMRNIATGPEFTEEETRLIVQKIPLDKLAGDARQKLANLTSDRTYNMLARNLEALMIIQDASGGIPS